MRILVTGGAGYIGSHTLLQLLQQGHEVAVYDNFSNSSPQALARVKRLANRDFVTIMADIRDAGQLNAIFGDFAPQAVVHFAGRKAVAESCDHPLMYYDENVSGSLALLASMQRHGCSRLVFSSTATIYGTPQYLPLDEAHPEHPENPYGRSKLMVEQIIRDWARAWDRASAVLLRYFNPIGAHVSGQIGEDPGGVPNNLLPYVAQVAIGQRPRLNVFGDDYDTRDGTGERDFIHVEDLSRAHLAAIDFAMHRQGCEVINIGTGHGATVLEMIRAFETASGRAVPYKIAPRRKGDIATSIASAEKARDLLGWVARHNIADMCASSWRWQVQNPNGFARGGG